MASSRDIDEYQVDENSIMHGSYLVKNLIGEGSYGKVVRCIKMFTGESVAVKVVRKNLKSSADKEVGVFKELSILDLDKCSVVKFYEAFTHDGSMCLVMEMLDRSLHHFILQQEGRPLCLSAIRVITQQMLAALNALKRIGLVHGDIKPDNVMLVDQCSRPFRIKLIDFGLAIPASNVKCGTTIQAIGYRAPEVILGLPVNEAADMWSLGCLLAFLYLGQHLYPLKCEYETIRILMQMHGGIDDHLLDAGMHTNKFFHKDTGSENQTWKLNTRTQYRIVTGKERKASKKFANIYTCLEDITKDHPQPLIDSEKEDTLRFLSLLKRMLHVDPAMRITPTEALEHEFITMRHFPDHTVPDPYVELSHERMRVCPSLESEADDGAHSTRSAGLPTASSLNVQINTGCTNNSPATAVERNTHNSGAAPQMKNKPASCASLPGHPNESKPVSRPKKSSLNCKPNKYKSKGKPKASKSKLAIKPKESKPEEKPKKCKPKESKPMHGGKSKEFKLGVKPKDSQPVGKPKEFKLGGKPNESKPEDKPNKCKPKESKPGLKPKNSQPSCKPNESKPAEKPNKCKPKEYNTAGNAKESKLGTKPKDSQPCGKPKESNAGSESEPNTSKPASEP